MWGLTFPMVQDAIGEVPVMTFLAYRFLAAAVIVALVFRRGLVGLTRSGWRAGMVMGIFLTGGYIFQTFGLEQTSASNAGFITGLFVVLTPLFARAFTREPVPRQGWAAAGISVLGLYLLSAFPGTSGTGQPGSVGGDALVFLCACSFALHIIVSDPAVKKHDVGALLVVQLAVCGVISLVVAGATGDLMVPESSSVWTALAVTAVAASAVGFFVQAYAQKNLPPARTALILASEPAFAGFFAYLLNGELLSPLGWLGASLILAAIVTVEVMLHLRTPRPLPEG